MKTSQAVFAIGLLATGAEAHKLHVTGQGFLEEYHKLQANSGSSNLA